jgi:hypothetical protein
VAPRHPPPAAPATATPGPTGTFNWLTLKYHWYQAEMDKIAADIGINPTSRASATTSTPTPSQQVGQVDLVSGDALWVPHY